MAVFKRILAVLAALWIMLSGLIFRSEKSAPDDIPVTYGLSEVGDGGIAINIDINSVVTPYLAKVAEINNVQESDLYSFVDQYDGTQVTDLAFNVFCQYSATPSDVFTDAVYKYEQTVENGIPVDYKSWFEGIYQLSQKGIDVYDVWFNRCKADGINAWLSVRMNDCHLPEEEVSFLRSDFFYTAKEHGWMIGEEYGYFRNCYDYSVPEVRAKMLDYIREQLLRYDVYGIELDWLREIYCFNYLNNTDCAEIMNGFMREVNGVVAQAEAKWGHEIKIMSRLTRDVEQSLAFGFDAKTWIDEALTDIIVISPRWSNCDSAMPVDDWLTLAGDSGVKIYAGIETLVNNDRINCHTTEEIVAGYAAQYLTAGADRIYLYNYYQNPYAPAKKLQTIFNTCGSIDTLLTSKRRCVVTSQDLYPEGYTPYQPLPQYITGDNTFSLKVHTGYVTDGSKATLILGLSGVMNISKMKVAVNGKACEYTGTTSVTSCDDSGNLLTNACIDDGVTLYAFTVEADGLPNTQTVKISNNDLSVVTAEYAEIAIN